MRIGVDDTKYCGLIIQAILESERFGQISPGTIKKLELTLGEIDEILRKNP